MTSLRPRAEHQEAVARRLALLTAEAAGGRPGTEPPGGDAWMDGHTRVRPIRAVPDPDLPPPHAPPAAPAPAVPPPEVPRPGRHASRRARGWGGLVPAALRGRATLGPAQIAVVAVLVAIGLAVTGWWVVRGDPERVQAPMTPTSLSTHPSMLADASPVAEQPGGAASAGAGASAGGAADGSVTVDVTGKVRRPGIVVLDAGARVVDALDAAGGPRRGVDLSSLNLARVLVDGEQVVVGQGTTVAGTAAAAASGAPPGALVNLNTATQPDLEALPEVGPVTAQAIMAWRDEHGGFTAVDELLEVDGIGDATLAKIAPHVTV